MLGLFTYWLVPGLICWGFETGNLVGFFSYPVEQYIKLLPLNEINSIFVQYNLPSELKSYEIAKQVVLSTVFGVVVAFTLPLRSICCTQLYKDIHKANYAGKIAADKLVQRAQAGTKNKKKDSEGNEE